MADSDALRTRRSRQHKAGDHSICRHEGGGMGPVPLGGQPVDDARSALRLLAGQLQAAYAREPGNALLARELRMTLQALVPSGGGPRDDELDELFAELGSA